MVYFCFRPLLLSPTPHTREIGAILPHVMILRPRVKAARSFPTWMPRQESAILNRASVTSKSGMAGNGAERISISVGKAFVEVEAAPAVTITEMRKAIESTPFKQWLFNLMGQKGILTSASCSLKKITIQSVDMFGPRVGFVKFKAEIIDDETGKKLPGIVFGRGGAVGILILLECNGEKYAVLTEQARVPVGRVILELPAGMLDDDAGDFVGTAAHEVEEETGIHIKSMDLVNLTSYLDGVTGQKMLPYPGGCDEEITLMLYRGWVKQEVINSLQGQKTGLRDHGEFIKVHVVPYKELWRSTADAKALAAVALYEMARKEGLLQAPPNAPELSSL